MEEANTRSIMHYRWFPAAGLLAFTCLYVIAAISYPGGSWVDPQSQGFSIRFNYLCDLLDAEAVNGSVNTARYWARAALLILCLSLMYLWYHLPVLTAGPAWNRRFIQLSAAAAFSTLFALGSGTHDITVRIAGVFGGLALLTALWGMWKAGRTGTVLFGIWCFAIFIVNYILYESGAYLRVLPLLQKGTFLSFIAWFLHLNVLLSRQHHAYGSGRPQYEA